MWVSRTGEWRWREPRHGEHFRTCSFCGCIHPEDLIAEPGWKANWAIGKFGYKFYVDIANRDPQTLFVVSTGSEPEPGEWGEWVSGHQLSDEQRIALAASRMLGSDGTVPDYVLFAPRPSHSAKFYVPHLADPMLPDEVKEAIFAGCGHRFSFQGGRVSSQPYVIN